MNKETEIIQKSFDTVWQRVTDSKSPPPAAPSVPVMPRKNMQKPMRRYERGV